MTNDDQEKLRPTSVRRRSAARLAAVQTLYQAWASEQDLSKTRPKFRRNFLPKLLEDFELDRINEDHYTALILNVTDDQSAIDELITPYLKDGWRLDRLNQVDRDVLRAAVVELRDFADTPALTVIAEYGAIANSCGCDSTFITAILDKLAHQLRADQME